MVGWLFFQHKDKEYEISPTFWVLKRDQLVQNVEIGENSHRQSHHLFAEEFLIMKIQTQGWMQDPSTFFDHLWKNVHLFSHMAC